ncbi:hypothetical protein ABPG74_013753 [Tetrahymena malaccensis]
MSYYNFNLLPLQLLTNQKENNKLLITKIYFQQIPFKLQKSQTKYCQFKKELMSFQTHVQTTKNTIVNHFSSQRQTQWARHASCEVFKNFDLLKTNKHTYNQLSNTFKVIYKKFILFIYLPLQKIYNFIKLHSKITPLIIQLKISQLRSSVHIYSKKVFIVNFIKKISIQVVRYTYLTIYLPYDHFISKILQISFVKK